MSQSMKHKSAPKRRTPSKKKSFEELPVVEEPEEVSGSEKMLENIKPHATTIGLAVIAAFVGFAAIAYLISGNFNQKSKAWTDLYRSATYAENRNDISQLKEVAAAYPNSQAGMRAALLAADFQLRVGVETLSTDREGGLELIRQSTVGFQTVLDAPPSATTTLLQRRSQFGLAYAFESLGEFAKANNLYTELVEAAPDSPIAALARRGISRSSNPDYLALYKKFSEWEDVLGEAPGAVLLGRPNIDFPEIEQDAESSVPGESENAEPVSETPPATTVQDDETSDSKTPETKNPESVVPDSTQKDDEKK